MNRTIFQVFIVLCVACLQSSCRTTRRVETMPEERIQTVTQHDTIYLHDLRYDSIYVSQDKSIDRSRDTVTITQTKTEFRYRLKRDTILTTRIIERTDSIPYEVVVTPTQEVRAPPTWFDKFAYTLVLVAILLIIILVAMRIRSPILTLIRKLL